jgi:hypothetical protein
MIWMTQLWKKKLWKDKKIIKVSKTKGNTKERIHLCIYKNSLLQKTCFYTLNIVLKMIDVTKLLLNSLSKMTKLTNFVYFTSLSKLDMFEMTLITLIWVKMDTTTYTCHFYACDVYVDVSMMINIKSLLPSIVTSDMQHLLHFNHGQCYFYNWVCLSM